MTDTGASDCLLISYGPVHGCLKGRKLFQIEILELKTNQLQDSTCNVNTPKVNDIYNWNYMHCEKNFFFFFVSFRNMVHLSLLLLQMFLTKVVLLSLVKFERASGVDEDK